MDTYRNFQLPPSDGNGRPLQVVSPIPTPASVDGEEAKWDLGELVAIARRRAIVMTGATVGVIAAGGSALFFLQQTTPPVYTGQFQVLVEPVTAEDKQARLSTQAQGADATSGLQTINVEQSTLDYETQIAVLRSPRLLEPIVKQLQTRYPDITYDTLIRRLDIVRVRSEVDKRQQEPTKLIQVLYRDTDPEKIQFVLDQISQAYLKYSLKERQTNIRQGIKFINGQLDPLRKRVDSLQREVQDLRQRYGLVDPDVQGQQLSARANTLEQQRADSQTQLAEIRSRYNNLQQQLQGANLPTVLGEAPYYQNLLNQYQELEGRIALESARLRPDNPALQALLDRRQQLQALMRQEATRVLGKTADQIEIAEARSRAIAESEGSVNERIQQLPFIARQYADLQRDLAIATESLNKFLIRREALQIDAAQQEVPWELTTPPDLLRNKLGEPMNTSAPNLLSFLALTVILGILVGVAVGFLVDASQDALQTTEDAKRTAKDLPLLGTIPVRDPRAGSLFGLEVKSNSTAALTLEREGPEFSNGSRMQPYESSPFTEAFRSLYKNIRFLRGLPTPVRSLTISSAEPGDGKSTIALNLAQAAAAMGQRVLLVDADLRHPQIHHLLGLPNQYGLSELVTTAVNVRDTIQQVPGRANLMVLTAGQVAADPGEILTAPRMLALMDRFLVAFDLVIYDTPPLVGLADSSLVAAHTHGLALVVRVGKTRRSLLLKALDDLKLSSTTVLGFVANCSKDAVSPPYDDRYRRNARSADNPAPVQVQL